MAKDPHNDTSLKNVTALASFRLRGKVVPKGAVVPKSDFAKTTDWQNLCNMEPPRAEETDAAPGMPTPPADDDAGDDADDDAGAAGKGKSGGLPGAA